MTGKKGPGEAGFTLIELMVAVSMLAVLAGQDIQFRPDGGANPGPL
jgi:prepilin-type N-terminal cleavage/methylation domain-containing protein